MLNSIHKGTELNNVRETWERNEAADKQNNESPDSDRSDLQQTIKEEAEEYDNANKEQRVLDGERASVSDRDKD